MPRKCRRHYTNAFYHVMARGNYRQQIFTDTDDYLKFYEFLKSTTERYHCSIHLFCLMTNHIHLVLEVKSVPLSKIMQSLLSNYARYINRKQ